MKRTSSFLNVRAVMLLCGLAFYSLVANAQVFTGTNAPGTAQNFSFTPGAGSTNLAVSVGGSPSTFSHLLLKAGVAPTDTSYDYIASLDAAGNAINLESPEFKLTNYFARVRTPVNSLQHVFNLTVLTNVADLRAATRPATKSLIWTNAGTLSAGAWHYYRVEITTNLGGWRILVGATNGTGPDLYIAKDITPTATTYLKRSFGATNDLLAFAPGELDPGAYFIGVNQASGSANYTIRTENISFTTLTWDPGTTHLGTQIFTNPDTNGGEYYLKITVQNTALGAWRTALNVTSGEANLYLNKGIAPLPNNAQYKSERPGSDGFVLPASAFSAGEDWYYLIQAAPGSQWNLVTGDPYVTDLGTVAADASSGSGPVTMGAEGYRYFQTTVPANSPAWRLYLNGQTNTLLVKKGGVPVQSATELSQNAALLVVPPYLIGGQLYFVGVNAAPGTSLNLDSRQQPIQDLAFLSATNISVNATQAAGGYPYRTYRVNVPTNAIAWQISTIVSNGNPNLAVRRNFIPNENYNDAYSELTNTITDSITLVPPTLSDDTYYITVYGSPAPGQTNTQYTCQLTSGEPEFTEISYHSATLNTDTNRTGWRFYKLSNIAEQLGTLGWDLQVTNYTPGTKIAIRRNAAPGIWNLRNPNPAAGGKVDLVSSGDFLQEPGHQADVWYVGVFNTNAPLGAFTLISGELTAEPLPFDNATATRTAIPANKWQFFRIDVPTNTLGWDIRLVNVTEGTPQIIIRRELLPTGRLTTGFINGLADLTWPGGAQWAGGADFTRRDFSADGLVNEQARSITMGYNRPLEAATYYIGIITTSGTTNQTTYTLLSRGMGAGFAIPVVDLPYTNGQVVNTLAARDVAVYRVQIPTNAPSWKVRLRNDTGDATLAAAKDHIPNVTAGVGTSVTNAQTQGKRMTILGNEHHLQLPGGLAALQPGAHLYPGTYYLLVCAEGQINPTNTFRIGTNASTYTLTSYGPMPETDLGLLGNADITVAGTLEGGESAAYHFQNDPWPQTMGFELTLEDRTGDPVMVSAFGDPDSPYPTPLADPGAATAAVGVNADPYGNEGGVGAVASRGYISVAGPYQNETVMVKARGSGIIYSNATYTLRIRKYIPQPLAFDGGSITISSQEHLYEFFQIEVPPNALGWDLRLTNVTGSARMIICRDYLPLNALTAYNPGTASTWPSGALWHVADDWTDRSLTSDGLVNEDGRVMAFGVGRPLEPGTYFVSVFNASAPTPCSYTIVSRGIGNGFTIPVVDLPFTGGTITNNNLAPRQAAYYRVIVPPGAKSWQARVSPTAGEVLLVGLSNTIPSVLSGRNNNAGKWISKAGKEQYLALPPPASNPNGPFTNYFLPAITNYFAVVSEGVTNAAFPSRIGTGTSSYVIESRGELQPIDLGDLGPDEKTDTGTLEGGEVRAYQFYVPPGTTSLEARLYTSNGTPVMVLRYGGETNTAILLADPGAASTSVGAGSVVAESYGTEGGQTIAALTGNANTNLITFANPTNGIYTIMVKARGNAAGFANATYTLGVRALAYTDVAFDGGAIVVTNHAVNTWRYYKIEVPTNGVLGWDLRLANVTAGLPKMVVRRDTLPSTLLTGPWGQPGVQTNWPTTNVWAAGADWTRRSFSADGAVNEDGRILAMGLGQPLEPGTYWVGVYGSSGTNAMRYTLLSRGIGEGLSIPAPILDYTGGSATVSNLPAREAAYFRVVVPPGAQPGGPPPGWKLRLAPSAGEAMLLVLSNHVPNVDSGRIQNALAGKLMQKAGNEHFVLLPQAGTNWIAGTNFIAVVSEGVNPASSSRIGSDNSSFTFTSVGQVPVTDLGTLSLTESVLAESLEGGETKFYQFRVPSSGLPAAFEVRLENRVGNPVLMVSTNGGLPDPAGSASAQDTYGNTGGVLPSDVNSNILTVANVAAGTCWVAVKARVTGTAWPDASYTLRVRLLPLPELNFSAELNTNGGVNGASGLLLDAQRSFYRVNVPSNFLGAPVLGWQLDVSQSSGVAWLRARKDTLPSDSIPLNSQMPWVQNAAVLVPPFLTPGTWYVEIRGSNSTAFSLTSSAVKLQRPAWTMPLAGATNAAPGVAWPLFADTGVDTNGVALPGDGGVDLELGRYHFYGVNVPTNNGGLFKVQLEAISGNPDAYVRSALAPSASHNSNGISGLTLDRSLTGNTTEYGNFVALDGKKSIRLDPGLWYLGLRASSNANARYRLKLGTGAIQDLDLATGNLTAQTVGGGDWRYYRLQIPDQMAATWNISFSQQAGDAVLHVRDSLTPGNGPTTAATDVKDWATDAKNNGPYPSFDAATNVTFTIPPVRLGTTYYLGVRGKVDSTYSISSTISGATNALPPIIPFYGGAVTNLIPPTNQVVYRILTPADALRWRNTSVHPSTTTIYIENGTFPTKTINDDYRSTGANSSADRLLTAWPWLPNQTYYLIATNPAATTQSFAFVMNGSSTSADSDTDGLPDGWEATYFGNLSQNGAGDYDGDGINNATELAEGTNPADKTSLRPRLTVLWTNGVVVWSPVASNYTVGDIVQFTATPAAGYELAGWAIGTGGAYGNPLLLPLTSNTTVTARFRVPGDDFDQRITIAGFSATSSPLVNSNATKEIGEPLHANNAGGRSLWWSWTAPASGPVTLGTAGGNFRPVLGIYTGNAVNALTLVTNAAAAAGSNNVGVTFSAVAGTTYQIAVDGYNGAAGSVAVSVSLSGGIVLSNPARLGDGLFHFTITSGAGAVLTVLASSDLVSWSQIAVVTNVTGTMDFADPASAGLARRYYRIGPAGGSPAAMSLVGVARLANGNVTFTVVGGVGQVFRVLANTSAVTTNWVTLGTLTNVTGSTPFTDTSATNYPGRFYRTVSP